jgi:hypothetical protein
MPAAGSKLRFVDSAVDFFSAYLDTTLSPGSSGAPLSLSKQSSNGGNMTLTSGGAGANIVRDGLYLVSYQFRTDRDVSSADPVITFRLNAGGVSGVGTAIRYVFANVASPNSGNYTVSGSFVYYFEEGDEIELFASSGSTATNFLVAGTTTSTVEVTRFPGTAMLS